MTKIEDLKLRNIDVLDSISLMSAGTGTSNSGSDGGSPIDGGSLKEVTIEGSAGSGSSGSVSWSGFGSYDWGSSWYTGSYNSGSSSGSGYGSYSSSGQCRVVEASYAPAIGTAWVTGEVVAAVSSIGAAMGIVLFAIMVCFTSDTPDYYSRCQRKYNDCINRGGSDSKPSNGQTKCNACYDECIGSRGATWNCQS